MNTKLIKVKGKFMLKWIHESQTFIELMMKWEMTKKLKENETKERNLLKEEYISVERI